MLTKKIVKYIQSLNLKKFRDEEGEFIAEGPKVVGEFLLSKNFEPRIICAEKNWLFDNAILLKEIDSGNIFEVDENDMSRLSQLKTPNKVVAIFAKNALIQAPGLEKQLTLMLDDLQDPGNLGTIIRIADWFGIKNIICSENSVECYNPKVVQSTMGSLDRVNIFYSDLFSFMNSHQEIPVYAAALSGKSIFEMGKITEGIILIGNESQGIHPDILKLSTHKVNIPRVGGAESLNAAVAAGIIVSHFVR